MRSAISSLAAAASYTALLLVAGVVGGCAAPEGDDDAEAEAEADVIASSDGAYDPAAAIRELREQTHGKNLREYYDDGVRVAACMKNPAAAILTEMQKIFYCEMPLEFRLCNTVKILIGDKSDVRSGLREFVKCQRTVQAVMGPKHDFIYSHNINKTYQQLYLKLNKQGEAQVKALAAPKSHKPFVWLLVEDGKGLFDEARKEGDAFRNLVEWSRRELKNHGAEPV